MDFFLKFINNFIDKVKFIFWLAAILIEFWREFSLKLPLFSGLENHDDLRSTLLILKEKS